MALLAELGEVVSVILRDPGERVPERSWEFATGNVEVDWAKRRLLRVAYPDAGASVTIPARFTCRIDARALPYGVQAEIVVFKPRDARITQLTVDHRRTLRRSLYTEGMAKHGDGWSWLQEVNEEPITTAGLRAIVPTDLLHVAIATAADWPGWDRVELEGQPMLLIEEWDKRLRSPQLMPRRGPYSVTDEHLRHVAHVYLSAARNPVQRVREVFGRDDLLPSRTTARRWIERARVQPWWADVARDHGTGDEVKGEKP